MSFEYSMEKIIGLIKSQPTELKGDVSIQSIARHQIERCNLVSASNDSSLFERNVEILMFMLPSDKLEDLRGREQEYCETIEKYQYRYNCAVPMGTPKNPIKDDDGTIISPILVEETIVDYDMLYSLVLRAFEKSGLTWKTDRISAEFGKIIKKGEKEKVPEPTPYFPKEIKGEPEKDGAS